MRAPRARSAARSHSRRRSRGDGVGPPTSYPTQTQSHTFSAFSVELTGAHIRFPANFDDASYKLKVDG